MDDQGNLQKLELEYGAEKKDLRALEMIRGVCFDVVNDMLHKVAIYSKCHAPMIITTTTRVQR